MSSSSTSSESWSHYPMGPQLRRYLGITESEYTGDRTASPSEDMVHEFRQFLSKTLSEQPPSDQAELIDLVEELTSMGLPALAIQLAETHPEVPIDSDFRACLALGSALMMENDLEEAIVFLSRAQALAPMELAPYSNLAAIAYAQEHDTEALSWVERGLEIDSNHHRLWEILASVYLQHEKTGAAEKVKAKAESLNSYAGYSLAAELLDSQDKLLKAELLERAFDEGARDEAFLIEYSAVLGLAQQYEKLTQLIWRLEKMEKRTLSWKLYAHAAQAYVAMEQFEQAEIMVRRAESASEAPSHVIEELREFLAQASEQPSV